MAVSITTYDQGEYTTHHGATVALVITRVWGKGARLHKNPGPSGAQWIVDADGENVARVERIEHDSPVTTWDALDRAQAALTVEEERLAEVQEDVDHQRAERDRVVAGLVEQGPRGTQAEIARRLHVSEAAVAKMVARGRARR